MDRPAYDIRMQQWIEIIQESNNSGLTRRAWCDQNGIPCRQFYYWQRKIRSLLATGGVGTPGLPLPDGMDGRQDPAPDADAAGRLEKDRPEKAGTVFCELSIAGPKESGLPPQAGNISVPHSTIMPARLMLIFNGYELHIGNGIDRDTLSTVLAVMRNA